MLSISVVGNGQSVCSLHHGAGLVLWHVHLSYWITSRAGTGHQNFHVPARV